MCGPNDDRPLVLFADDDPDILGAFEVFGNLKGWRVITATTARDTIKQVNEHCKAGCCPDCIVTDINFQDKQPGPRFTGVMAVGQIRKKWPNVPVIFYSAYLDTVIKDEIESMGNAEAVEKLGRNSSGTLIGPGRSNDIVGVIERVESILKWSPKKYEGPDRRATKPSTTYAGPYRRVTDEDDDVKIPEALEAAFSEATLIRSMHTEATKP